MDFILILFEIDTYIIQPCKNNRYQVFYQIPSQAWISSHENKKALSPLYYKNFF